MANLYKTKTLFGFTSPRTIEKIIPEIRLLCKNYSGKKWTTDIQGAFYEDLIQSDFFESESKAKDTELAARDRITRAPKALGFVNLKPTIELTEIGEQLLTERRIDETITKQLLKFQLPSPYHTDSKNVFFVKPYLEFIRLVNTVKSISKAETAMFFLQLTNISQFEVVVNKIYDYRKQLIEWKGNRKAYIEQCFVNEIYSIYKDEIFDDRLDTRESNDKSVSKFIKTKKQNMVDYADAFIRYVRATQLITFEPKTYRIIISPSKTKDVAFILQNTVREPEIFKTENEYKKYLFAAENIKLLIHNRDLLITKLENLNIEFDKTISNINILKDILEQTEERIKSEKNHETSNQLKNYKDFDDIIEVFQKIQKREVPDPPLYLEWNIWRCMVMLNYAIFINGNFTIDIDGVPLNTAKGNMPDIEIEYDSFKMIVEVTTSTGNTQYNMEGEPVARHFGNIQKITAKPVFCFFIAPKISEGALAHFFNLNRMNTKAYGGKTRIIPMTIIQFIKFITAAKSLVFSDSTILYEYLNSVICDVFCVEDEVKWFENINDSISRWLNFKRCA